MAIDKGVLNKLYHEIFGGSYEAFSQIVDMFVSDTPKSLAELKQSYESGDLKAVVHISHTLKSNSASLGAMKFSEICAVLETEGRAGSISDFNKCYDDLVQEFDVCSQEIAAEIKASAA